jgi:hypothetical protein
MAEAPPALWNRIPVGVEKFKPLFEVVLTFGSNTLQLPFQKGSSTTAAAACDDDGRCHQVKVAPHARSVKKAQDALFSEPTFSDKST